MLLRLIENHGDSKYLVWLFVNGYFQSVPVDSVFPIDDANNFLLTHSNRVPLGLLIILKSLCKLYKTYNMQLLQKISVDEIYFTLTGMSMQSYNRFHISGLSGSEFHRMIRSHKEKGSLCLRYVEGKQEMVKLELGTVKRSHSISKTQDT